MLSRVIPEGVDHPEVAECLTAVGGLYLSLGQRSTALQLTTAAVAMRQRLAVAAVT